MASLVRADLRLTRTCQWVSVREGRRIGSESRGGVCILIERRVGTRDTSIDNTVLGKMERRRVRHRRIALTVGGFSPVGVGVSVCNEAP